MPTATVATSIHDASHAVVTSVPTGTTVHDAATVSGSLGTPTGNVDFTFYTSGNCTTGASASGTGIALVAGVAHPSSSQGPLNLGAYSFKAHYNGDSNYNAADSPCEPLSVGPVGGIVDIQVGTAVEYTVQTRTGGGGLPTPALAIAAATVIAAAAALYRRRRYLR